MSCGCMIDIWRVECTISYECMVRVDKCEVVGLRGAAKKK